MSQNTTLRARAIVPSVQKAFKILEFLAAQKNGYTITELSRQFKIPVSTMNNLLLTLVHCGYLRRTETGTFHVTMKLLDEAAKVMENNDLHTVAREDLKRLAGKTGFSAILSVRDGDEMVCVDKEEGASQIRVASHIGKRFHLHSNATGKAVLANLPPAEVESIAARTGLPRVTSNTITSLKALRAELERIRTQGYATDNEETTIGIRGVAAPIFDHTGQVSGAISTGGVGFQIDERMGAVISAVKECARSVSEKLGYRGPRPDQDHPKIRNKTVS